MVALELSSTAAVAHFLGIDDPLSAEDSYDVEHALLVGREQITAMVRPAERLPDPLPESLHRACTVRSAEVYADAGQRYGYQAPAGDDVDGGPPPARYIIRDLIEPWKRPSVGIGPNPSAQVFDDF